MPPGDLEGLLPLLEVSHGNSAQARGKCGNKVVPGAMPGTLERVFRMQPRRDLLVQVLGDRVRLEQGPPVHLQHRDFPVRRQLEEPVRLVAQIDVGDFKVHVLGAQDNHGALYPRSGV